MAGHKQTVTDPVITCRFTITSVDEKNRAEAEAVFTNQYQETVLEASLFGVLPNARERQVLQDLLGRDA